MKKVKYITALLLVASVLLCGCESAISSKVYSVENERFDFVERVSENTMIVKDKDTDVLYLFSSAGVCVMVDAEGKPLVDKGE